MWVYKNNNKKTYHDPKSSLSGEMVIQKYIYIYIYIYIKYIPLKSIHLHSF
ncbi:hypothetical protein ACMBCN_02380 [Candidatus Liberibacter asiaticus]